MKFSILNTEKDYNLALSRVEMIFDSKERDPTFEEAEMLMMLIDNYEEDNHQTDSPDSVEAVKCRM